MAKAWWYKPKYIKADYFKSLPVSVSRGAKVICALCLYKISKGQSYHRGAWGRCAHEKCVDEQRM